jgi:hypothetical protein
MGYPETLTHEIFDDRSPWNKLRVPDGNIQIASFQIPMIYAGYVERVIWIRPSWSHQIADGKEIINVGNIIKSTKVTSDSRSPYGQVPQLENTKQVLDPIKFLVCSRGDQSETRKGKIGGFLNVKTRSRSNPT